MKKVLSIILAVILTAGCLSVMEKNLTVLKEALNQEKAD